MYERRIESLEYRFNILHKCKIQWDGKQNVENRVCLESINEMTTTVN